MGVWTAAFRRISAWKLNKHLLSDAEMQQFIAQGYVQVQADFPGEFHAAVCRQIDAVLAAEGNPGNNIAPRIPAIAEVFAHPAVRGALTSISGRGLSDAPTPLLPSQFPRQRRPELAQGRLYLRPEYPLSPLPLGDGLLLSTGRHSGYGAHRRDAGAAVVQRHLQCRSSASYRDRNWACAAPAGTVSIVNFDSWHRATANRSDKRRYMLKYQFTRMTEPEVPTWNNKVSHWQPLDGDPHPALSRHVWDWLCGRSAASSGSARWEDLGARLGKRPACKRPIAWEGTK